MKSFKLWNFLNTFLLCFHAWNGSVPLLDLLYDSADSYPWEFFMCNLIQTSCFGLWLTHFHVALMIKYFFICINFFNVILAWFHDFDYMFSKIYLTNHIIHANWFSSCKHVLIFKSFLVKCKFRPFSYRAFFMSFISRPDEFLLKTFQMFT